MLTELCQELRNWFDKKRYFDTFTVEDGALAVSFLVPGQYYRIVGSYFNDGVHQYGHEAKNELTDETFDGAVWSLAIPKEVVQLADEIAAWRQKYEAADSAAMSPYMSESFGGYSYQKGSALTGGDSGGGTSWRATFRSRLNMWRKL